jgi:hypothetical protein
MYFYLYVATFWFDLFVKKCPTGRKHSATSQKTAIFILVAVRTRNLTWIQPAEDSRVQSQVLVNTTTNFRIL